MKSPPVNTESTGYSRTHLFLTLLSAYDPVRQRKRDAHTSISKVFATLAFDSEPLISSSPKKRLLTSFAFPAAKMSCFLCSGWECAIALRLIALTAQPQY